MSGDAFVTTSAGTATPEGNGVESASAPSPATRGELMMLKMVLLSSWLVSPEWRRSAWFVTALRAVTDLCLRIRLPEAPAAPDAGVNSRAVALRLPPEESKEIRRSILAMDDVVFDEMKSERGRERTILISRSISSMRWLGGWFGGLRMLSFSISSMRRARRPVVRGEIVVKMSARGPIGVPGGSLEAGGWLARISASSVWCR